jgi:hypothetical protein
METLADRRLSPIPDSKMVLAEIRNLECYFELYGHYSNGGMLSFDFPQKHLNRFPDRSYKQLLMTAIANQMNTVNTYISIQHYANGMDIPSDFPESVTDQFPNRSCIHQLKGAINTLQQDINNEKAMM